MNSSVCVLSDRYAFGGTPLSSSSLTGTFGSIYVPASLYNAYKTAANWSFYSARFVSV
jgi:hypothetical protein